MTVDDIKKLLKQIKIFYPRFDAVDKTDKGYELNDDVKDAWYKRIGWMDLDRALKILDDYMESEQGSKTPGIALWMNNGRVMKRSENYDTAVFDRQRGIVVWKPDPAGDTFERPVSWSNEEGCYVDQDGYRWATAED